MCVCTASSFGGSRSTCHLRLIEDVHQQQKNLGLDVVDPEMICLIRFGKDNNLYKVCVPLPEKRMETCSGLC